MTSRLSPSKIFVLLGLVATLVAATARPADAATGAKGGLLTCPGTVEQPFLPWLDPIKYTLVSNGAFENGSQSWALTGGASVVFGNEPYYVHSRSDSHSLTIPAGGSATSAPTCFSLGKLTLRFVAKSSKPLALMRVRIVCRGVLGVLCVLDGPVVVGSTSWQPTLPLLFLGSTLGVPLGTSSIQIKLVPLDGASWQIDDVYVDPWISR